MTDLSALSTPALIALYNQHADKPVKRFESRAVAEKRVAALLATVDAEAAPQSEAGNSGASPATLGMLAAKADDEAREQAATVSATVEPVGGLTGAKLAILRMMQRVDGISAEEAAKELGWVRCGATLSRTIRAATAVGIEIAKVRGEDRSMRYVAVA